MDRATNESPCSLLRIPAACKLIEDEPPVHPSATFLWEVGLVKEIKPEHVVPAYFCD
jgi:hypothetical protein